MTAVVTTQVDLTSGQPTEQRQSGGGALVVGIPSASSTCAPSNATTTAYAASLVAKATPGVCIYVSGYNSKGSAQFIQIHDAAALPADAAVPKIVFTVPATSNFTISFGEFGRYFSNGIVVCNSSTGPAKNIGSDDCWIDVQYA